MVLKKTNNIIFVGGLTEERMKICQKFNIKHIEAYGEDYVKAMQSGKICFNQSISYDINAKYFEIMGSGTFMLTNYNKYFHDFVDNNKDIEKMFYSSEEDLGNKIQYYLNNEKEREEIALRVKEYVNSNHTWENRAELILKNL